MMADEALLVERHAATLLLKMNRASQRNAIDLELRAALAEAVYMARDDDGIRAVVLTSVGGNFSAGGDLKSLTAQDRSLAQDRQRVRDVHHWLSELVHLDKPVIAAVDGAAFGAGFSLALAADFVIATPRARFCAVFARIGLVPDFAMGWLLPRMVGSQRAKEIMFTAREVSSEEAMALGIVLERVEPVALLEHALALAARMTEASPEAFGLCKQLIGRAFHLGYAELAEFESHAQAQAIHSDYHRRAVEDFLARRPARFQWSPAAGAK